jgi:hypothetical protein
VQCKEKLDKLGADRDSSDQQRQYLQQMAVEAQKLTDYAIDAYYARHKAFEEIPEFRLSTLIVDHNDQFAKSIEIYGHTADFRLPEVATIDEDAISRFLVSETPPLDYTEHSLPCSPASTFPAAEAHGQLLNDPECSILTDLLPPSWERPSPPSENIIQWIEREYRNSRSYGLEAVGASVLPILWQQQSKNWEGVTLDYMSKVIIFVHAFVCKLLHYVCPDKRTFSGLCSILQDSLVERYVKALHHVKFIVSVERFGTPLTLNHYFSDNLQKFRQDRLQKALEKMAVTGNQIGFSPRISLEKHIRLDSVTTAVPMGNLENILDIHSILKAYYKVARKRFVDTVCMQGTNHHLISGADSPLRIFSPLFISKLSAEQLEQVAGEDMGTRRIRKSLKVEIEALEKGKKLLRGV